MKKYLLLATILLVIAMFPVISANVIAPVTATNYTTTTTLNCTYSNRTAGDIGVTIPTTANSYWTYNSSGTDTAIAHTSFACTNISCTATADLSVLTDGIYTIKCNMSNATASNMSSLNSTDVMFDSTNPTCTIGLSHKSMPWKGVQQVDWTSTDAIELLSTAIIVDRPQSGADMTYTDASRELTLTSQDTKYRGDWTFGLLATDPAGNIGTCNDSWKTYLPDGEEWEEEPTGIPGWLIIVAIIGIIYLISKKK